MLLMPVYWTAVQIEILMFESEFQMVTMPKYFYTEQDKYFLVLNRYLSMCISIKAFIFSLIIYCHKLRKRKAL